MATIPTITEETPASYAEATVMADISAAITADANHSVIDTANGGADGIIYTPASASYSYYTSIRRDGAGKLLFGISPAGAITTAGGPSLAPAGTTSDWSGEAELDLALFSSGSKLWMKSLEDSLHFEWTNAADTVVLRLVQLGEIWIPWDLDDPSRGVDGLGILCGQPALHATGTNNDAILSDTTQSRVHYATDDWQAAAFQTLSYPTADDGPNYKPVPYLVIVDHTSGTTFDHTLGYYKYYRRKTQTRVNKTRIESTVSDQAWKHISGLTTVTETVDLWRKGVAP